MLEILEQIDVELFYFINVSLQNPFFDWFMPFITEKTHWFPVWGITIILLLWKGGRQGRIVVLLVIPVIIMSDQLAAQVFKPLIGRVRPCVALSDVHLLVKMKTSFSLPSAHAANFFALATFFTIFYQRYKWWFFSAAFLVALSRVSVGVHYPFDVFAGAILGSVCALVITKLWKYANAKYIRNSTPPKNESV